jgi:hypothetical protein
MSDTTPREASMAPRAKDAGSDQAHLNADDQIVAAEQAERDVPAPLFAKLAPRPSALGVTYSLI